MTIGHLTSLALCIPCVHVLRCPVLNNDPGLPSGVGQDPPFLPGTIEGLAFPGTRPTTSAYPCTGSRTHRGTASRDYHYDNDLIKLDQDFLFDRCEQCSILLTRMIRIAQRVKPSDIDFEDQHQGSSLLAWYMRQVRHVCCSDVC